MWLSPPQPPWCPGSSPIFSAAPITPSTTSRESGHCIPSPEGEPPGLGAMGTLLFQPPAHTDMDHHSAADHRPQSRFRMINPVTAPVGTQAPRGQLQEVLGEALEVSALSRATGSGRDSHASTQGDRWDPCTAEPEQCWVYPVAQSCWGRPCVPPTHTHTETEVQRGVTNFLPLLGLDQGCLG